MMRSMPSACVRVLHRPPYHGDRMAAALTGLGYRIAMAPESKPKPVDVLVLWNRYPRDEGFCRAYDAAGARIIIIENGYFGRNFKGSEWYAVALSQHNGCGRWAKASADRWRALGIELKPWRKEGREIVLLATRHMGSEETAEPKTWLGDLQRWLRRETERPVRVRQHPGPQGAVPKVSLEDDLKDAWAAMTWGSSAGLKALAMGVPVFHGLKGWIGSSASRWLGGGVDIKESRFFGKRAPMFHRVASAMWSLEEIESGKAFKCLLA